MIDTVYFRILDSTNSSFEHKQQTLLVFSKIFDKPRTILEFFVNYDCCVGQNNLVERILGNQCKII
jgi:brefeldin A-inhibited guanine nucleotide-exchange protein